MCASVCVRNDEFENYRIRVGKLWLEMTATNVCVCSVTGKYFVVEKFIGGCDNNRYNRNVHMDTALLQFGFGIFAA